MYLYCRVPPLQGLLVFSGARTGIWGHNAHQNWVIPPQDIAVSREIPSEICRPGLYSIINCFFFLTDQVDGLLVFSRQSFFQNPGNVSTFTLNGMKSIKLSNSKALATIFYIHWFRLIDLSIWREKTFGKKRTADKCYRTSEAPFSKIGRLATSELLPVSVQSTFFLSMFVPLWG